MQYDDTYYVTAHVDPDQARRHAESRAHDLGRPMVLAFGTWTESGFHTDTTEKVLP